LMLTRRVRRRHRYPILGGPAEFVVARRASQHPRGAESKSAVAHNCIL
jgi:hypothetical protein